MPLASAALGLGIRHVCAGCLQERPVLPTEVRSHVGITSSPGFSIDCPTCNATESFEWHDWVYLSNFPVGENGFEQRPDPDHPGAGQMVLIERVARALGFANPTRTEGRSVAYPSPPKAPDEDEVRAYARAIHREAGRRPRG